MAEALLFFTSEARPATTYQDGDVVDAFTERRILACNGERLCHRRQAGFTSEGLRPSGVSQKWYELTSQYRFQRVGTSVARENLITGEVDVLGPTPNEQGEHIDVEAFLKRRLAHEGHAIFGVPGSEVWFGGTKDFSLPNIQKVWDMIETHTPHRRADHKKWPLTPHEKRNFLAVPLVDFDDLLASQWAAPEMDESDPENPIMLRKRAHFGPWRDVVNNNLRNRILSRIQEVDLRETLSPRQLNWITRKLG